MPSCNCLRSASVQSFYSSRLDSYIMPQGPTGGLGVVGKLLQQLGLLWLGIANDDLGSVWSVPYPVALPHHTWSAAWLGPVASPGTVAMPCVWSAGPTLHCSHTVAACLHVLQALNAVPSHTLCRHMMALMSGVLKTCVRALGTCCDVPP
jgi:hypothetical protein